MESFFSAVGLAQKRILITGGNSGIGLATAKLLAQYQVRLFIIGRDQEKLDQAVAQIKKQDDDVEVCGMSVDLSQPAEIRKMFESVDQHWGGLDVMLNNAALGYGSVLDGSNEDWQYVIDTNLTAYLACCRAAAKRMEQQGGGHIINIGSMSADTKDAESSVYVATKSGLQGFCEAFRKEVNEKNIHVTLIEPGAVNTPMQQMDEAEKEKQVRKAEMLHANDIANSILYVLSQPQRCAVVDLKIRPLKQLI